MTIKTREELRAVPVLGDFEFRASDEGAELSAYAALFDTPSDAPWLPYTETIKRGAFTRSLGSKRDRSLVLNHDDNLLLASTRTGRLRLTEDERGLKVEANLAKTSYAADLKALYEAGEVRGMSFSFKPTAKGIAQTDKGRELTDVDLGHVTVITSLVPGYSATGQTVHMRALADELSAEPDDIEALFDAIRAGTVREDQSGLLDRLAARFHIDPPEPEMQMRSLDEWKSLLAERGIRPVQPAEEPGATPGAA